MSSDFPLALSLLSLVARIPRDNHYTMNISVRFVLQSIILGISAAFLIIFLFPQLIHPDSADQATAGQAVSYALAVKRAAPAVVNVYASKLTQDTPNSLFQDPLFQRFFGDNQPSTGQRRDSSLGSGVIMHERGFILTNAHVIDGMNDISITLNDGRQSAARVIGIDKDTDLAVLKVDMKSLPTIPLGDSSTLRIGDVVLAIGNPYDFGQTVTQGIVSAKGRKRMGITTLEDFIQTDADINPGNSGGALVTAEGRLVGINTAIISSSGGSQGIGLATPVNEALNIMQQLIEHGRVIRGWLGIEAQILSPDMKREMGQNHNGIMVAGVLQGGPADNAGIIPGDVILQIAGKPIYDPQQAIEMITDLKPGSNVDIEILRGWKKIHIQAVVAYRPIFNS